MTASLHRSAQASAAVGALAVLVTGLLVGFASSAHAHARLMDASPAEDETVDAGLEHIELTFSEAIEVPPDGLVVRDEADEEVGLADVDMGLTPAIMLGELAEPLTTSGEYMVRWRVLSADGHPIEGEYSFTVAGGAAEPPAEDPEPAEEPADEAPAEEEEAPPPEEADTPEEDADADDAEDAEDAEEDADEEEEMAVDEAVAEDEGEDGLGWLVWALIAALVVVGVAAVLLRRLAPEEPGDVEAGETTETADLSSGESSPPEAD